jgi:hypothetical protein
MPVPYSYLPESEEEIFLNFITPKEEGAEQELKYIESLEAKYFDKGGED